MHFISNTFQNAIDTKIIILFYKILFEIYMAKQRNIDYYVYRNNQILFFVFKILIDFDFFQFFK